MHIAHGLEGVVVAETSLSQVDGERGELIIAGARVDALSGIERYETVCQRLWRSDAVHLGAERLKAHAWLERHGAALALPDGMDALRALISQLPSDTSREHLVAAMGVFAAAWVRTQARQPVLPPRPELPHADDVLRLITGQEAPTLARALDAYLVAVVDHGMNASTFTARVIASTQSDLVSAVTGALGALKGPLHGGAPGPVLDMLDAVGVPERAAAWLEGELDARRRVMGMGHRVYRVRDPRAAVLERALEQLERDGVSSPRLTLARAVEQVATRVLAQRYPDRGLQANVEFYTAVLLDTVGLPREAFTPMFAVGRVAGWCAHVQEQRATGRLIRPESRYIGPAPQ